MDFGKDDGDLFKWNKHNSRLKARIKDDSSNQSVHAWLRKIEAVSENAINQLREEETGTQSRKVTKTTKPSDNAYSEAHDLLNQWVTDKIRFDIDDDLYNYVNINEMSRFEKNMDSLYELDDVATPKKDLNSEYSFLDINSLDYDKYDEDYIVKDIVNGLLKKNYVNSKDLLQSDEKKKKDLDIRAKIEMRHKLVKENREKRNKEKEEKRKERLAREEAERTAKETLRQEDERKKIRQKIEKELLEQEVERLRREMAEQRKQEEEIRRREQEMEILKSERERQEMLQKQKLIEFTVNEMAIEAKKRELEEKRNEELVQSYLKAKKMRFMQSAFSSWYGLILETRLKNGKSKALYDWKLSYKLFNAWKKLCLTNKVKKEQEFHENIVKIESQKMAKALHYYNMKLLAKCIDTWRFFVGSEKLAKQIEQEKLEKKNKMQKFLEAAAEGKLCPPEQSNSQKDEPKPKPEKKFSTLRRPNSASNLRSAKSERTTDRSRTERSNESASELDLQLNLTQTDRDDASMNRKVKQMMWPWVKTPFVANNLEHRYKAHEKLLHDQQKMIKEQQRMIEEMKYQQSQVAFKEQISLLEQIKAKQDELERMQKIQMKQEKQMNKSKKQVEIAAIEQVVELSSSSESEIEVNLTNAHSEKTPSSVTNRSEATKSATTTARTPVPSFLRNMEERAKQRDQMKREREEKRKIQELEKLKILQQHQEEKLRAEEEEKRKKMEEFKEKKRVERDLNAKREAEKRRETIMQTKADNFFKKYLMRYYCMTGLRKLLEIRDRNMQIAERHFAKVELRKAINQWKMVVKQQVEFKNYAADRFYRKYLLNIYFKQGFQKLKMSVQLEEAKAQRHYRYHLKVKLFAHWKVYKQKEKIKFMEIESWLGGYYEEKVKKKMLKAWKMLPSEMKKERERQKRVEDMRKRVQSLLPDFGTALKSASSSIAATESFK